MLTTICLSSAFIFFVGLVNIGVTGGAQKATPAGSPSTIVVTAIVQLGLIASLVYAACVVNR